jgi:arylsulfatase A-like enzyme
MLRGSGPAAAYLLLAGCRHGGEHGFQLRQSVESGSYTIGAHQVEGLNFPSAPELRDLEVDHERRPVVLTTEQGWSWRGRVPAGAELHAGVQLLPVVGRDVRGLEVVVEARSGDEREVLQVARSRSPDAARWLDLASDLGAYAGREIEVTFTTVIKGLPRRDRRSNVVAWGPVSLSAPQPGSHPNIVFILIDTLRRDRLTPYGYHRDTSPEIARRLAAAGTLMENAYSQAPWTLPSVVSFMTGRYPGQLVEGGTVPDGIPANVEPLAERLAKLGFETGGFLANPTLQVGAGFERGFKTIYAPPPEVEWINKHADELNRHILPWLAAHQDRPFFLYAHYIDPHDPYDNPEIVGNLSPFETSYGGPVAGTWVHGLYAGKLKLPDPARDLAHLNALYDSEVHYVDRFVGQLLAAIKPEVLSHTLVVLTADHGEELLDHGGWKHGQSLYEEQIHVPLIFRWDHHIPAGRRLGGTVRLLDLLPTLMDAAGGAADPRAEGLDLLPYLTSAKNIPEKPAFAIGLSGGPLRAAAILQGTKLILFNREEPVRTTGELQEYLWRHDLERLEGAESYDLARDPRERNNLFGSGSGPEDQRVALLQTVIERRLDSTLPGLRILAHGFPAGSRLVGSVRFERPPEHCMPYFLGSADHLLQRGRWVRFTIAAEALDKGLRVEGELGGIVTLEATLDGQPLEGTQMRIGAGAAHHGGPLTPEALGARSWPVPPSEAARGALLLWRHDAAARAAPRQPLDPETERRLRALGYL